MVQRIRTPCYYFFFSSRRRHTRSKRDWSSDVCSSDLVSAAAKVTITAGTAEISAATLTVNAGMSKFSGVVQADTVITNSVVSASYTPGRSEERRVGKEWRAGGWR